MQSRFKHMARSETERLLLYTPEHCTNLCAVTDSHLGKMVKDQVKIIFDDDFAEYPDVWTEDGLLSAADRRMLFVQWLSKSWT